MRPAGIAFSIFAVYCSGQLFAASPVHAPQWTELPPAARSLALEMGFTAGNFSGKLAEIDQRTANRLRDGEYDHMIFYMLQSTSFTSAAPVEPAGSAVEYMQGGAREIPRGVQTRMEAFVRAMAAPANERQRTFAALLQGGEPAAVIRAHYVRGMQFLYRKESACRGAEVPQTCVASTYEQRGLSSDTSPESMAAVRAGVAWLADNRRRLQIRRVLIVGPGVDFAPRTALREDSPPRVYQPRAVRELIGAAKVDCADINPRVLSFAQSTCDATFEMNIATGTIGGAEKWDLIIATNVLLYLDDRELLLAFNNIRMMLNPGGIFLHNDGRFSANLFGKACGLPVIHFAEVELDKHRIPPLTDRFVLHAADAVQ
jgi:hypothetical protein